MPGCLHRDADLRRPDRSRILYGTPSISVCATIRRFSSRDHRRRVRCPRAIVHPLWCPLTHSGHLHTLPNREACDHRDSSHKGGNRKKGPRLSPPTARPQPRRGKVKGAPPDKQTRAGATRNAVQGPSFVDAPSVPATGQQSVRRRDQIRVRIEC